jgi:hypothetical protein
MVPEDGEEDGEYSQEPEYVTEAVPNCTISCLSLAPPGQLYPASHATPAADVDPTGQKYPTEAVHGRQVADPDDA